MTRNEALQFIARRNALGLLAEGTLTEETRALDALVREGLAAWVSDARGEGLQLTAAGHAALPQAPSPTTEASEVTEAPKTPRGDVSPSTIALWLFSQACLAYVLFTASLDVLLATVGACIGWIFLVAGWGRRDKELPLPPAGEGGG